MIAGTLRAISNPVSTGTRSNQGDILKVDDRLEEKSAIIPTSEVLCMRLTTRNTIDVITNEGTVVIIMNLICVKSGVPAEEDARTVVSDNGDTLSPKYAPEIMAPAVQHGSYP